MKIFEDNSGFGLLKNHIDTSLNNMFYREVSFFQRADVPVFSYKFKDTFSRYEEKRYKELRT